MLWEIHFFHGSFRRAEIIGARILNLRQHWGISRVWRVARGSKYLNLIPNPINKNKASTEELPKIKGQAKQFK